MRREVGGWAAALGDANTEKRREVLKTPVATITPIRVGYGKYEVAITWTPLGRALGQFRDVMAAA